MTKLTLKERIYAAFMGKNLGGTMGMPYEGCETRCNIDFFCPIPKEPLPNDDLDLQLIWVRAFQEHGIKLDAEILSQYWLKNIDVHWDEYGVAICNLKNGIKPPLSGIHNNYFINSMGAAIRSEVWAALFPKRPLTSAYFAWQDSQVDHNDDGIFGEVYWAALQSMLFGGAELLESMDKSLAYLPANSKLKQAFLAIDQQKNAKVEAQVALNAIWEDIYSVNFTDVVMNCSIAYWALRYGDGDFEKTLLLAVNVGQDADCTAATVGACIGANQGIKAIPARYLSVIGEKIVVGSYVKMSGLPATISELTDLLCELQASYEVKNLPEIQSLPLELEKVQDFSEKRSYYVNGRRIEFDGIKLSAEKYSEFAGEMINFETEVEILNDENLVIMVASRGLFIVTINGEKQALKGDQARPVPGVHRVRGGRAIPYKVKKGQKLNIRIEVYPTMPIPDLYVGFFDWTNRHVDVKFVL